jgi:high-affinity K+ transport system ATPase subunit B
MLTGDQRSTAEAVGRQVGLVPEAIRSRLAPEDKLDLIKGLQARGEIVAMRATAPTTRRRLHLAGALLEGLKARGASKGGST